MDTLSRDDAEVRRRLSDLTRRITVYRVNEKALTRRYQTMEETDGQLRKVRERVVSEYMLQDKFWLLLLIFANSLNPEHSTVE